LPGGCIRRAGAPWLHHPPPDRLFETAMSGSMQRA
jgi:hypothetical protein